MKKRFASLALCAGFFFSSLSINAVDFGLVFTQNAEANVPDFDFESAVYDVSGILTPRFTALLGETGDLYVSAAANYETDPLAIIPELARTDFSFNLGYTDIRVGRMFYSDPLGLAVNNLFDGAQVSFVTRGGNIRAGGWYTGFLYRKRAAITMTASELQSSYVKVDNNDFVNTYFAPSRVLIAIEYDHPSLAGFIGLKASILAQYDMGKDKLNSRYFTAALSVPVRYCILDLGGCFELIEYDDGITPAFAADIGLTFILPAKLEKQIRISGRYSSGESEGKDFGAFLPVTTVPQGEVVEAKFSAVSLLCAEFTGRLAGALSANMAFTYFMRNDLGTYRGYPAEGVVSEGFLLGGEIFGRVIWNITPGLRLNLGTGVFMPGLGDVNPEGRMLWRSKLNLVVSIY